MMSSRWATTPPGRIVCIEGPSAAGKTSLALELGRKLKASMVPEPDSSDAPAIRDSAEWFAQLAAKNWTVAANRAERSSVVILDGDPLKGLWYNWIYSSEGWPDVSQTRSSFLRQIDAGKLGLPDLYVLLIATEVQLRKRRASDASRTRRNFEKHLQMIEPQRRYFRAVSASGLVEVLELDTSDRESMIEKLQTAVASARPPGNAAEFVQVMSQWVEDNPVS
jgi:thymidylate kinase